jgi:hypothetical protein
MEYHSIPRWVIVKQDVSLCSEVDQDQRLLRINALLSPLHSLFHFLILSFHPFHQILVDNGFVSGPIGFQPRLQSRRACLQVSTPTLQENILHSPARHCRVKDGN